MVAVLSSVRTKRFVLDGELGIPLGNGLSFDALQMRLHPAESRIHRLARETPAILILFDALLTSRGRSLLDAPLSVRRTALEAIHGDFGDSAQLQLSPYTRRLVEARRWLRQADGALDGVIAKRLSAPYSPGERAMVKVKRLRTADCVVGGFRYAQSSRMVGSLLLGLYNEVGKLDHVGFTASIAAAERASLTRRLETLIAPPGFTGAAPDAQSRWSTERTAAWTPLKPKLVVEVCYDHVTGDRSRHGTRLLRWRPDKLPRQCTFEQLAPPSRPSKLAASLRR
jgi:ATP-dependent DNA ligase